MTIMLPTMKVTVQFTGNDAQTRHKWVLYSDADTIEDCARDITTHILTPSPVSDATGPEAWITSMDIERTR